MFRSLALALALAAICSLIFVLPSVQQSQSALSLDIPEYFGDWTTETFPPSEKELRALAKDTKFARALCTLPRSEEMSYIFGTSPKDQADLSIVLSGYDLANSIHRPERCMPAQGFSGLASSPASLTMANGTEIPLTRILSKRASTFVDESGKQHEFTLDYLTYYFFVGHDTITASHTKRTLIDILDRVAKGEAQRWAFVMLSIPYKAEGEHEYGEALLSYEAADKKIRQLMAELAERNIDWKSVKG